MIQEHHAAYEAGTYEQRVELPAQGMYMVELLTPMGVKAVKVVAGGR